MAFITPVLTYAAQYQAEQPRRRTTCKDTRSPDAEPGLVRPDMALRDFSNWSDYVAELPPVLLVRVTPELAEGFWTMVARGPARTQGVSILPIKRFKPGFARFRAFCGDAAVTPIHPFKLRRVPETDAIHEGLYVVDPDALGPQCGTVKLVLFGEGAREGRDTRGRSGRGPAVLAGLRPLSSAGSLSLEIALPGLESYSGARPHETRRDGVGTRVG